MVYSTIKDCKNDPILTHVRDILLNTGISGSFVEYGLNEGVADSGVYLVASLNDVRNWDFDNKSPADIQRKIEGNPYSFYPYEFAIKVTDEDPMVVVDKLAEYCKKAEMLRVYFTLENVEVPHKIKIGDYGYIKAFFDNSRDKKISHEMAAYSADRAKQYIKDLKSNNDKPMKFKNKDEEILYFMREYKHVSMHTIEEEDVHDFINFLKSYYPDLEYVMSDKIVVDTGLGVEKCGWNPYGEAVSGKMEAREFYYKAVDDAAIQAALNYTLVSKYLKPISLADVSKDGPVYCVQVPSRFISDFDQYCGSVNVKYAVDHGYYDKPDRDSIPVIVNAKNSEVVDMILNEICTSVAKEHYVPMYERELYQDKIKEKEEKNPRHFFKKPYSVER